ncbi:MAG TPA: Zn-ribbon domain-containing OB-fold protein [Terriglobales bacterium]|nr:Zn-ribbon domain-containing OB-fold protein [Terriglobales bacterium]
MSEKPYEGPLPVATPETKPFWDGARQNKLMLQRCGDCGQAFFYPRPLCPHCLSRRIEWFEASGRGRLHTFVINHRAPRRSPLPPPFVVAIIALEEGPKMMSNLVGIAPDPTQIRCDMPVEVVFEHVTAEISLPRFRPVA